MRVSLPHFTARRRTGIHIGVQVIFSYLGQKIVQRQTGTRYGNDDQLLPS